MLRRRSWSSASRMSSGLRHGKGAIRGQPHSCECSCADATTRLKLFADEDPIRSEFTVRCECRLCGVDGRCRTMMHEIMRMIGKRMCNECDVHDSIHNFLPSEASGSARSRSEGMGMRPRSRSPRGRLAVVVHSDTDEEDGEGEASRSGGKGDKGKAAPSSEDKGNGGAADEWTCWEDPL